ncbi:hypothetical protein ERICII_02681 [Paenibacillus larvae subsp. larvae DSM 25430]|nr:hypothetical protein ERICII_02681 [Paenibacillus larvae subsp. larvae DSM 25430]
MNFREMWEAALFATVVGSTMMAISAAWILLLSWLKVVIS